MTILKHRAATRGTRPGAGAASLIASSLRSGWTRLVVLNRRIENGFAGDLLGLICVTVISIGLPVCLWAVMP